MLTQLAYRHYGEAVTDVMPALGCHEPLTEEERETMFEIVPAELFRVHDWRNDVVTVGSPPPSLYMVNTGGQTETECCTGDRESFVRLSKNLRESKCWCGGDSTEVGTILRLESHTRD